MNGFDLSTISNLYVGSTQYSQIYKGSDLIWQSSPYDAEIEYLESTGTQWIDIGYKHHTGSTKYETSVVLTNINQNNYNSLFGARIDHDGAEAYYIGITRNGVAYSCIGGNKKESLCSLSINTRYDIVSDPSTGWIINGTTYNSAANNTSTRSLYNCYLYSLNQSGINIENTAMKIYYFKIYEGSVLMMDLIPVRVGQVGYMYDRVSGQLFGNSGTGNFTLGQDIVEVEYLESSGTQYIDLGFYPSAATHAILDAQMSNINSYYDGAETIGQNGQNRFQICCIYQGCFHFGCGTEWMNTISADTNRHIFQLWGDGNCAVDNQSYLISENCNFIQSVDSLYIFAGNYESRDVHYGTVKIYSFKMYENDVLTLDLIPVRVGQVGYMYDKVSGQLFGNSGSGSFILGPDKS